MTQAEFRHKDLYRVYPIQESVRRFGPPRGGALVAIDIDTMWRWRRMDGFDDLDDLGVYVLVSQKEKLRSSDDDWFPKISDGEAWCLRALHEASRCVGVWRMAYQHVAGWCSDKFCYDITHFRYWHLRKYKKKYPVRKWVEIDPADIGRMASTPPRPLTPHQHCLFCEP